MPIKDVPPNKGTPYGFTTHYTLQGDQNRLDFLNNLPIFIPTPMSVHLRGQIPVQSYLFGVTRLELSGFKPNPPHILLRFASRDMRWVWLEPT